MPKTIDTQRLARKIMRGFVEDAIAVGALDPKGKSEAQFQTEVREYLRAVAHPESQLAWRIDHTPDLLRRARAHARNEELHLAALFFATWCEHWVNNVLSISLRRRHFTDAEVSRVIRDTPFRARIGWLPKLLELPRINERHVKAITTINDLRNSYVHFKWKAHDMDTDSEEEVSLAANIPAFEKTVRYLQRYFSGSVAKNAKSKARRVLP